MKEYVGLFIVLLGVSYLYEKYKVKEEREIQVNENDIIQKYLLNEHAISSNKPIIWVHIEYDVNSRNWLSFGSRNTTQLNQPYKHITIKSIIESAEEDFNVCLIDDDSFYKLLPNWSINLSKLANPIKTHMRTLGILKLLYTYGGFLIPDSYVSLRPLRELYNIGLGGMDESCFVCETKNTGITSTYTETFPNHKFMGCTRENTIIGDMIQYIEHLNSRDFTSEQDFLGSVNRKCYEYIYNGAMKMIDGKLIGTKTRENKPVLIDDLLQSSYINFCDSLKGIHVNEREILIRKKYQWFARMSPEQIFNSDMLLSKYLLLSSSV